MEENSFKVQLKWRINPKQPHTIKSLLSMNLIKKQTVALGYSYYYLLNNKKYFGIQRGKKACNKKFGKEHLYNLLEKKRVDESILKQPNSSLTPFLKA